MKLVDMLGARTLAETSPVVLMRTSPHTHPPWTMVQWFVGFYVAGSSANEAQIALGDALGKTE